LARSPASDSPEGEKPTTGPGASPSRAGKRGYGIDDPNSILELAAAGIVAISIGFLTSFYEVRTNPSLARLTLLVGPGVGFLVLAVASALYWSSQQGKVDEMARVVANIPWGGSEVVLDIGCGRGLGMVLAGKRLDDKGVALGIDVWKGSHLSGNDPSSIWANAAKEGVSDRVAPVKADTNSLPFPAASVDVVLSAVSMHKLIKKSDRLLAFTEIARVLKEGGRIGILDAGRGSEYSKVLRTVGMSDISVRRLRSPTLRPFHVVMARKPFQG